MLSGSSYNIFVIHHATFCITVVNDKALSFAATLKLQAL